MSDGQETPGVLEGLAGGNGPAVREERAEIEVLRDEADRAAADAARTLAQLAWRLSPRELLSPGRIAARLKGNRTVRLATVVLPVAAALAAAVIVTAAVRRRSH